MKRNEIAARLMAASLAFTLVLPQASIVAMAEGNDQQVTTEVTASTDEDKSEEPEQTEEEQTSEDEKESEEKDTKDEEKSEEKKSDEEKNSDGEQPEEKKDAKDDEQSDEEKNAEDEKSDENKDSDDETKSDDEDKKDDVVEDETEELPEIETGKNKVTVVTEGDDVAVEAGKAVVDGTVYDSLKEAVDAAKSGATVYLGEGKYTLYNQGAQTKGKDLTFVGKGDQTEWGIGATMPDPDKFGTEYNGDYSFDGAGTITFKNMTLKSGTVNYLGFIRADKTVVEDCTINGKTSYWGYTSAEFKNTTFNAPSGDYALWTYSSPEMTFDTCTFNGSGKFINVYRDYEGKAYTINVKDCTVNDNSWGGNKTFLNINDSYPSGQSYTINFFGTNEMTKKDYSVCSISCSRLFGFSSRDYQNAGNTTVNIDGTTVFTNGEQVSHSMPAQHYTAGDDENAYSYKTYMHTDNDGKITYTRYKVCDYCGWSEESSVSADTYDYIGGDMLIDDQTEHDAVVEVARGQKFNMTGTLDVTSIKEQLAAVYNSFGGDYSLKNLKYSFTATMKVPNGITLPDQDTIEYEATGLGGGPNPYWWRDDIPQVFEVTQDNVKVSGNTVTVEFTMTEDAIDYCNSIGNLNDAVQTVADTIKITIKDVAVNNNAPYNRNLTMEGTVGGKFSAFAYSVQVASLDAEDGIALSSVTVTPGVEDGDWGYTIAFDWKGKQTPDGLDAILKDKEDQKDNIQLTVIIPGSTPSEPDPEPQPTPEPAHTDDHPLPEPVQTITETGAVEEIPVVTPQPEEVTEITESGSVETPAITENGAIIATGDDSQMMLYGIAAFMAAAVLAGWMIKRHI